MKPIPFKEMNKILLVPLGEPVHDIEDLSVFRDVGQVISCWKLSLVDRLLILLTGRMWLRINTKRN